VRSVDRILLHAWVPKLQTAGGLIGFLQDRGFKIPSPALLGKNRERYVEEIRAFAAANGIPIVRFGRRESKQEIARPHLERAEREALQALCDRLGPDQIWRFFRRWEKRLPQPLTAEDRARGYRYDLAFRQLELSDTRVFDRPQAGRAWFEQTLRDQLALGRPDRVALVFA